MYCYYYCFTYKALLVYANTIMIIHVHYPLGYSHKANNYVITSTLVLNYHCVVLYITHLQILLLLTVKESVHNLMVLWN